MSQRSTSADVSSRAFGRRRFLMGLGGASAGLLSGCAGLSGEPALPPAGTVGRAALLAPLTGPQASVGQIMRAAASLGGRSVASGSEVAVFDTGGTEESAVAAARAALDSGARMLLGPLLSGQARAVGAMAGRVPVVAMTNDVSVATRSLFVFGLTPAQSARAVIGFASARGQRRIGVVVPGTDFGRLQVAAAQAAGQAAGAQVAAPVVTDSAAGVVAALRAGSGGTLPDAVYLPIVGGAFEAQAAALSEAGVQILGSSQWSAIVPWRVPGLIDAWFAAPDPIRYEAFAAALQDETGVEPGVLAGLAFDGVEMARLLGRLGQQDRDGLLREGGFDGVLGPYRFTPDGQCDRQLAVLRVAKGATTLIGATGA